MWSPSRAAAERAARRRSSFYPHINVWPFVGVMVALLSLFLARATPLHQGLWAGVDLPAALHVSSEPRALREDAIRIAVTSDGTVYFGNSRVNPEDLTGLIRQSVKEGSERKVYLAVDARSRYGRTTAVLEQIREAGIRQICFLAEKPVKT